jgi:hypothetical protein
MFYSQNRTELLEAYSAKPWKIVEYNGSFRKNVHNSTLSKILSLRAGHSPFFSVPEEFVAILTSSEVLRLCVKVTIR